jgi:hypothetical protein
MNDAELRARIHDALTRRLGAGLPGAPAADAPRPAPIVSFRDHPSHATYVTVVNGGDACVIEPGVACDHCGYCKSHGH